jgi:Uncharacterised nucleotidyltransferase
MPPIAAVNARLYQAFTEVARGMKLRGTDPGLELAGRFGVRRFIERHLAGGDQAGVPAEPPKEASRWLERAARLRKEARAVSRALAEAGVRHCFFKGVTLLGRFYRLDERQLADIDLIVALDHYSEALATIHGLGYSELRKSGVWVPATRRPGVTLHRTDLLGDDDDEVLIDLHWGLESLATVLPDEELILPPTVWAGVEPERGLPTLNDEHHAAVVLHHLVRHDMLHVRGLLDFVLLWQAIPKDGGQMLANLARSLGVERALRVVGRVMVDELMLYPLRGVPLRARDWRGRAALRQLRLKPWLAWAARHVAERTPHLRVTRSLLWRRFLLADAPRVGRLIRDLVAPPREYLEWRWSDAGGNAWGRHVTSALRG